MEMSKKKIAIDQLDIFSIIEELSRKQAEAASSPSINGKASIDAAVRSIISDALKRCPLSRYEVAAKMSDILGVEITKSQIDSWSAESKENHRFPFVYTGAFCQSTGDKTLARYMAKLCDGYFIEGKEALYMELGKIQEQKKDLDSREELIKRTLKEIERGR
jgi:hypothetical protein